MSTTKYLVETSAVRAALGDSSHAHSMHFRQAVAGGSLHTSTYIRMEFIRRWICDSIRMALTIFQCSDVPTALVMLEQDFSPRNIKGAITVLAKWLKETGAINNTRNAAEEVAGQAVRWLRQFDSVFASRINNVCRCQIGNLTPSVDYNFILDDLRKFYETFRTPITDCEVNAFLQFGAGRGRAATLLSDVRVGNLTVGQNLAKLSIGPRFVTCKECSTIGDAVIALEQPKSWSLVHIDNSFNDLCRVRKRQHKQIQSLTSVMRESGG